MTATPYRSPVLPHTRWGQHSWSYAFFGMLVKSPVAISFVLAAFAFNIAGQGQTSPTALAQALVSGSLSVKSSGAKGNGTADDTAAIQSAMDSARSANGLDIVFPNGTYRVTKTLTWRQGARLIGSQGKASGAAFYSQICWDGAPNGIMFEAEQTGDDFSFTEMRQLTLTACHANKPAHLIHFSMPVDWGTTFWKVQFSSTTGNAIQLDQGFTNLYMYDFRADNIEGYVVSATVSSASAPGLLTLNDFTWDSGTSGLAAGVISIDASASTPSGSNVVLSMTNARIEQNGRLAGADPAIILLKPNPLFGDGAQFHVRLGSIWMPIASGVNAAAVVYQLTSAIQDQMVVKWDDVFFTNPQGHTIIGGNKAQGPTGVNSNVSGLFAPPALGGAGVNDNRMWLGTALDFASVNGTPSLPGANQVRVYATTTGGQPVLEFAFPNGNRVTLNGSQSGAVAVK